MDLIRTKFRQSTDYKFEMLVRDLIQYSLEIEDILKDNGARLDALEDGYSNHESRIDALEILTASHTATLATHTTQIANLFLATTDLDVRLDILEALNIATRLTAAEGRLTALEGQYETGAWTPDLQFGGAKVGITYTANPYSRIGKWARYGKLCIAQFSIQLANKGTSAGVARVHGLPAAFNSISTATGSIAPGWISYIGSFVNTSGYFGMSCMGWDIANALTLYQPDDASGANADSTNFSNATLMIGGCIHVQP